MSFLSFLLVLKLTPTLFSREPVDEAVGDRERMLEDVPKTDDAASEEVANAVLRTEAQ